MIKSIQQFQKKGVKKLEKIFESYSADLTKIAEMVQGVTTNVVKLGCSMIAEEWEFYDQALRNHRELRKEWKIIRCDKVSRLTSLGEVTYKRTYYKNKKTGERRYLLDDLMGFGLKERMTEDADEDHVALQYLEKKGAIKFSYNNTFMPKLVYVYEGINTENDRHELINVKYFGGGYQGPKEVKQLWKEVYDYIYDTYDEDSLEKIYVNGDGAGWIEKGAEVYAKATFVLDKFHLQKYIISATTHLKDLADDARNEIWEAINGGHKKAASSIFDRIIDVTESESKKKTVEVSKKYIIGHWKAIMKGIKTIKTIFIVVQKDMSVMCFQIE